MARVEIRSEVAGTICAIEAGAGTSVATGDVILFVECMKMEIPVVAPRAGTVRLLVAEKEAVRERQVLAVIDE